MTGAGGLRGLLSSFLRLERPSHLERSCRYSPDEGHHSKDEDDPSDAGRQSTSGCAGTPGQSAPIQIDLVPEPT